MDESYKEYVYSEKIRNLDPDIFAKLGRDLLINGLVNELQCSFVADPGFNNLKNTSHQGHPDTILLHLEDEGKKIAVEFTTTKKSTTKLFEDVDSCINIFEQDSDFQYYVCMTTSEKEASQIKNKDNILLKEYIATKLNIPKENVFYVGFSQILLSRQNALLQKVWSTSGLNTDSIYQNIEEFLVGKSPSCSQGLYNGIEKVLRLILKNDKSSAIISYKDGGQKEDIINALANISYEIILKDHSCPDIKDVIVSRISDISESNREKRTFEILPNPKDKLGLLALHLNSYVSEVNCCAVVDLLSSVIPNDCKSKVIVLLKNDEHDMLTEKSPSLKSVVYPIEIIEARSEGNKVSLEEYEETVKKITGKYKSRTDFITSIIYSVDAISLRSKEFCKNLCELLNINVSALKEILEILVANGVIIKVGDLYILEDRELGKEIFVRTLLQEEYDLNNIIQKLELYE